MGERYTTLQFGRLLYRGKELVATGHFKRELYDVYGKNLNLALEILEEGEHERESREKVLVRKRSKGGTWELVYAETGSEIVLVHIKFVR